MRLITCKHTCKKKWYLLAGCLVSLLVAVFPIQVWAWGPQGHRIIAEIAERRLKPEVWQTIQKEFSIKHLADVANWADEIKSKRKETRPWHYCNIAAGEFTYSRERDCPTGDCVVEKIREFAGKLRDPIVKGRIRTEAFRFLIHFMGDIHQPLHLGNKADRGGNSIKVVVRGERTNLHTVWDHGLIRLHGKSLIEYAAGLSGTISNVDADTWGSSRISGWANESRKLALHQGYPLEINKRRELSTRYLAAGEKTVELQFKKAGVRLAHVLSQIFKP